MTLAKLRVVDLGRGERLPLGTLADAGGRLLFEFSPEAVSRGIEASPLRVPLPRPGAQASALTGPAHSHGLPGFRAATRRKLLSQLPRISSE